MALFVSHGRRPHSSCCPANSGQTRGGENLEEYNDHHDGHEEQSVSASVPR